MIFRVLLLYLFVAPLLQLSGQSVLEKSGIIKIATSAEGVYKITPELLRKANVDPQNIDPTKIQVYGLAGGTIDQRNSTPFYNSPVSLPMLKNANQNAQFEAGEWLAFYADEVNDLVFDATSDKYNYNYNYYADSLYFFIDIESDLPQNLITASNNQVSSASRMLDFYEKVYVHDQNLVNILNSGREWYGESFLTQRERVFNFNLPQSILSGKQVQLETNYLAQTLNANERLSISVGGFKLAELPLYRISDAPYTVEGNESISTNVLSTSLLTNKEEIQVELAHIKSGTSKSSGYLNYFVLSLPLELEYKNEQLIIRNREMQTSDAFQLKIRNASSDLLVWDVSNPLAAKRINHSNGEFNYLPTEKEVKFVAFSESELRSPNYIQTLQASTLQAKSSVDFLIISHPNFIPAASKLATHKSTLNSWNVKVANVYDIYNDYSSGRADIGAIRNYIRDVLKESSSTLKNVMIFGSGSFNYKDAGDGDINFVPIYQSRNSIHPVYTYSSDDFYGFMDEDEGYWPEDGTDISDLDLGIGRLACTSLVQAQNYVNKVIKYETNKDTFGKWRNDIYFVADDEDSRSTTQLNAYYEDSEQLSSNILSQNNQFNIKKMYLGSFKQENYASYQRSPEMRDAMDKMIQKGALIVNYIGHGAHNSWMDEAILTNQMIEKWNNKNSFPVFLTATCEFGRHDSPGITSGAQLLLHMNDAGSIGLLTTSRPVEANSNYKLNEAFYDQVFQMEGGRARRLGEIFRRTKNNSIDREKNRNFILLGDPSIKIGYGENRVVVDSVLSSIAGDDTLRAQDRIMISGHIENNFAAQLSDFEGEIICELFDKPFKSSTLIQENPFEYLSYDKSLFRGRAKVKNGEFTVEFYIPSEINYSIDAGKLSFYAVDNTSLKTAIGYGLPQIGGSISTNMSDNSGPEITSFLNDSTFQSGDKVGANNELYIQLYDEYGISISETSLNKGIYYQLDKGKFNSLNDFFFYNLDSYQSGEISLKLPELEEGRHEIAIGAQDIFNNNSSHFIEFYVVNNESINILDFVAFPNPADTKVNLTFSHNRSDETTQLRMSIIDLSGQLVLAKHYEMSNSSRQNLEWDLRSNSGVKVSEGMYFLVLEIQSLVDRTKSRRIKKLIIIN